MVEGKDSPLQVEGAVVETTPNVSVPVYFDYLIVEPLVLDCEGVGTEEVAYELT